jgi:type IV pilus assembly protein PilB
MSDPSNIFAIDDIKFLTGYNIEVVVASEAAIQTAIEKYYGDGRRDARRRRAQLRRGHG